MDMESVVPLQSLVRSRRSDTALSAEERAVYENFAIEERVADGRLQKYGRAFGSAPLPSLDVFWQQHRIRYLNEHQFVEKDDGSVPDTFDVTLNGPNFWTGIDDDVVLYRLEQVSWALKGSSVDLAEFEIAVRESTARPGVDFHVNLTPRGCGVILGLVSVD